MKLSGSHTVPLDVAGAYRLLRDPAALAGSIPGCEALDPIGDSQYRMRMKMLIGSLSGQFAGTVSVVDEQPPRSFRLKLDAAGKIGFVNAEGRVTLSPSGQSTQVNYDGDVQVGGLIAGVGQRLIDSTSRSMIRKFFDRLSQRATAA